MSVEVTPSRMDVSAIEGVDVETLELGPEWIKGGIAMRQRVKGLLPIAVRLHAAWKMGEPERIVAFLMRDNPNLLEVARLMMGLEDMDFGPAMMEEAVREDDYAKMLVMLHAGETFEVKGVIETFEDALRQQAYSRLILHMFNANTRLANALGESWADYFVVLVKHRQGDDYLAGQVLLGLMNSRNQGAFEAGLPRAMKSIIEELGGEGDAGVFETFLRIMAMEFKPENAFKTILKQKFGEAWSRY